jgi:hypothetical protein
MKIKKWLVLSVVVVIALLGTAGLHSFYGGQRAGAKAEIPKNKERRNKMKKSWLVVISLVATIAMFGVSSAMILGGAAASLPLESDEYCPIQAWENSEIGQNSMRISKALERLELVNLAAKGPFAGLYVDPQTATIYVKFTEMKDEYTKPIKAVVNEVEGVNLVFLKARFTKAELESFIKKLELEFFGIAEAEVAKLYEIYCIERNEAIINKRIEELIAERRKNRITEIDVPITMYGVDIRNNRLSIGLREIKPQYIEAIRQVVGTEVPIEFVEAEIIIPMPIHPNPEHMEAFEELVNASPDLIARGVPIVGFDQHWVTPDPNTDIANIVIIVGLREVKDEYKELIKAIVEGVEGIEFDFFQARFTSEEISRWQDEIVNTFLPGRRLPPGVIDVPLSHTSSSWRCQRIWLSIYGEIKPEYIEAIRMVVGQEAPLEFESTGVRPWGPRYFREMWTPEEAEYKQLWVDVFERLFPEVDILNMRMWEAEEFLKTLTPEKWAELGRALLDYAVERGLMTPEERDELHQEWIKTREEIIHSIW